MIRARTSAGVKAIQTISARGASGLIEVAIGKIRTAAGLKQFFAGASPITVIASPVAVSGASAGFSTVTTNSTSASPSGGVSPYTYAWTLLSDDGGTWGILSPSSAVTSFNCGDVNSGDQFNATFRCAVTDALGSVGTVDVSANVINYGGIYP